jgi:hypothetical protein
VNAAGTAARPRWRIPPGQVSSGPRPEALAHSQLGEGLLWMAVTAAAAAATALLVASGRLLDDAPLATDWPPRVGPVSLLAPAVAVIVLGVAAVLGTSAHRPRWPAPPFPVLAGAAYLATVAWWIALGSASRGGVRAPDELLGAADASPGHLLRAAADRPPGADLLVWVLGELGVHGAGPVGVALTAIGALVVPAVVLATRSLCHEPAARRMIPVLVLAPWAPFAVASPQAVTAALGAGAVAVGAIGSEPGRRAWWALGSGLLLGLAGLFGYPAVWLGVGIAAAYFVRRRQLLNVITGVGALVPLFAFQVAGFSWPDGLAVAGAGVLGRNTLAWLVPDLLIVLIGCGPVLVRAVHRIAMTPGWPFLAGAGAASLFSLVAGLAVGGVEATWLALLPWLVVPALAPRPRPPRLGDTLRAGETPVGLVAMGALLAVALAAVLAAPDPAGGRTSAATRSSAPAIYTPNLTPHGP